MAKGFRLPFEYVLYELSYANAILYCASLPTYKTGKDDKKRKHKEIKADDPRNRDKVRNFLNSIP